MNIKSGGEVQYTFYKEMIGQDDYVFTESSYGCEYDVKVRESKVFKTKEELITNL